MLLPPLWFSAFLHRVDAIDGDKEKLVDAEEPFSFCSLSPAKIRVFPAIIVPMFNVAYDMHEETLWTCVSSWYVFIVELFFSTHNWTHCPDGVVNTFASPFDSFFIGMPEIAEIASTTLLLASSFPFCKRVVLLV